MLWKGFQKPKRLAVDTSTLTDKYGIFWRRVNRDELNPKIGAQKQHTHTKNREPQQTG
jgi:hypothetical protein